MKLPQDIIVTDLETGREFEDTLTSYVECEGLCKSNSGIIFLKSGISWSKKDPRYVFRFKSNDNKLRKLKLLVSIELDTKLSSNEKIADDLLARLIESYQELNIPDTVKSIEVEDYRKITKIKFKEKLK